MKKLELDKILNVPDLDRYIERVNDQLSLSVASAPVNIYKALERLLTAPAKRLRPALLLSVVINSKHKVTNKVILAATVIELLHLSSLIHDDIIDNSTSRWSLPTINHQEGVSLAIIAGDYLFAKSLEIGSQLGAETANLLAKAYVDMTAGQALEMSDLFNQERTINSYMKTIDGKTVALITAACQLGGVCAGFSENKLSALYEYGKYFGRSFQVIDDMLDFVGDAKLVGKQIGIDSKDGVYNLPMILSLKSTSSDILSKLLPANSDSRVKQIIKIITTNGSLTDSLKVVAYNNQAAISSFKTFKDEQAGLQRLPDAYLQWAINNQAKLRFR